MEKNFSPDQGRKMGKFLMLSPEKCTSCRTCELACSFRHEREFNPTRSRVSVLSYEKAGISVPFMCLQCANAACVKICPMGAITRNQQTGAMVVNHISCIKCGMCISICPFGCTKYDIVNDLIIKCDLCGGDPACAKNCKSGAIVFQESSISSLSKRKAMATKFKKIFAGGD